MNNISKILLFVIFIFAISVFAMSEEEARIAFEAAFGTTMDNGELSDVEKKAIINFNEKTSIMVFMQDLFKNKNEQIYIIFPDMSYKDAAYILFSGIASKRGYSRKASGKVAKIKGISAKKMKDSDFYNSRSIVIGNYSNNRFFKKMISLGAINIGSHRSSFRLYAKPNSLFIGVKQKEMAVEVLRVLLRSYKDFDGATYSYFYID